jgi:predicted peptidase
MKDLLTAVGLGLVLAGCAGAVTRSQHPLPSSVQIMSRTSAPTTLPSPAPTPTPSTSPVASPDGITAHPADSEGNDIGLLSYVPPGYGEGDRVEWPLLVFLHGSEENGDGGEAQLPKVLKNGIPQMIAAGEWPAELPFVVLMPQYSATEANGPCALNDEIESVIEWAGRTYRIDPARIYLTGISCGAIGVLDYLAGSQEQTVAATVPISSAPYEGSYAGARVRGGCAIARTPTWLFHGALDDIVPVHYVEDAVSELHACKDPPPKEVRLTVYPDAGHDAWTRTYDLSAGNDVYAWLLEQELD